MADIELVIKIPEEDYEYLKSHNKDGLYNAILNGTPKETVTEFADRCRECGREKIIDKIRAEIVDLGQRTMNDNRASGIWACRDIIDKYKKVR